MSALLLPPAPPAASAETLAVQKQATSPTSLKRKVIIDQDAFGPGGPNLQSS